MQVNDLVYRKYSNKIGKIIFINEGVPVARLYDGNKKISYEALTEDYNLLIGRKEIEKYFKYLDEQPIEKKESVEKRTEYRNQISILEVKLKALLLERDSIQRHQSENPTKTRERQLWCIKKGIRKTQKRINGWKHQLIRIQRQVLLKEQAKQQGKQQRKELLAIMDSLMEEK